VGLIEGLFHLRWARRALSTTFPIRAEANSLPMSLSSASPAQGCLDAEGRGASLSPSLPQALRAQHIVGENS